MGSRVSSFPESSLLGCLYGVSLFPDFIISIEDFVKGPDKYDFSGTRAIANLDVLQHESASVNNEDAQSKDKNGDVEVGSNEVPIDDDTRMLVASFKRVMWYSLALTVIVTVLGTL